MTTTILEATGELAYRVRRALPRRPLILLLHGLGGDEQVMWSFADVLPLAATVISPRALYASGFGGYSWAQTTAPRDLDQIDFGPAIEVLQRFVPEMIRQYQADANRVIVLGFSQGAALSYALSLSAPEMMCGVIALAGFMPENQRQLSTTRRERTLSEVPAETKGQAKSAQHFALRSAPLGQDAYPRHGYLIIHGLEDEDVPIERARQARSILEERGAPIEYHEYPAGHKIPAQGVKDIAQWIKRVL